MVPLEFLSPHSHRWVFSDQVMVGKRGLLSCLLTPWELLSRAALPSKSPNESLQEVNPNWQWVEMSATTGERVSTTERQTAGMRSINGCFKFAFTVLEPSISLKGPAIVEDQVLENSGHKPNVHEYQLFRRTGKFLGSMYFVLCQALKRFHLGFCLNFFKTHWNNGCLESPSGSGPCPATAVGRSGGAQSSKEYSWLSAAWKQQREQELHARQAIPKIKWGTGGEWTRRRYF